MKPGSVEKISEAQALAEVKAHKEKLKDNKQGDISILGETANTSWIKLIQSKIKFWNSSAGRYEYGLKLSYQWLSEPTWKLTDVVGITKSSYMNVVNGTDYAYYNYDYWDGRITQTVNDYSSGAEHGTVYGLAFDVDLKNLSPDGNYPATNHRGYMYYEVAPASSQYTTMEVRGHYAHLAMTVDFGVSLTSGDMSITGANEVDYANDTFYTYSL